MKIPKFLLGACLNMTSKNEAIGMSAELDIGYVNRWRYVECERIQYIHTEKSRGLRCPQGMLGLRKSLHVGSVPLPHILE